MVDYVPEDADAFARMLKVFDLCETSEELKAATLLYLVAMTYPRADLLMAERITRSDKGWNCILD